MLSSTTFCCLRFDKTHFFLQTKSNFLTKTVQLNENIRYLSQFEVNFSEKYKNVVLKQIKKASQCSYIRHSFKYMMIASEMLSRCFENFTILQYMTFSKIFRYPTCCFSSLNFWWLLSTFIRGAILRFATAHATTLLVVVLLIF